MPAHLNEKNRGIGDAIRAADAVATPDSPVRESEKTGAKLVQMKLKEKDHRRVKAVFAKAGLPLATGVKLATLYVTGLVEDGAISISEAGIIDRRG
jgi:hypothetical protein